MKKQLLFFLIMPILPVYLYAQISIGEMNYDNISDAIGASVDGDTIKIAGAVMLNSQVAFTHTEGTRTILGTTSDASIKLANGTRFILEAAGETVFANITVIGADIAHEDWGAMFALFNGPKLVFKNDTIRGAKTSQHAGALRVTSGATVEAYSTVFRDNEANQNGGAFFIEAGNTQTTFENCLFLNNKAGVGSADAKGGALFYTHGTDMKDHIVKNSAFIGNSSSNHGGAVGSESVPLTYVNTTFSGNTANNNGGAIWLFHTAEEFTTTFVNSTLYGNNAGDNGGAVFMNHATTHIDLQNTVVAENTGGGNGIGIAADQLPATIMAKNSFFAPLPTDLTVDAEGVDNLTEGDLHLAEINVAEGVLWHEVTSGESVLATLGNPALLSTYSTTDQRGTERDMDAEYITAGSFQFEGEIGGGGGGDTFTGTIAIGETSYELLTEAIEASVSGDVIEISGAVELTEQVGLTHASGIRTFRGIIPGSSITLANSARFILEAAGETVFENITINGAEQAHEDWGAIFTLFNGPTLILRNDTIRGAKTLAHAGAMRITAGATVEAYNTVFTENESNQNGGVAFIETNNTTTIFEDCVFLRNKCGVNNPDAKGAVLFYAQGENEGEQTIENCTFIQNESGNHGGAIGMETVSPVIVNTTFAENSAFDNGGAIWMWNGSGESTTTIVNCTFVNNSAGNGGALFMNQAESHYDIINSVFSENGEMPIATGTAPATISVRHSYYLELPEGLTESSGATSNLHEGELYLADINLDDSVVWYDVTSAESVLVGLGNPGLLRNYSRVDQLGNERDLDGAGITAGSIEYLGDPANPTGLEDELKVQITVHPNPASDYLLVNTFREGEISIYTINGALIKTERIEKGENRIDTSTLPKSLYVIRSTSVDGSGYIRFVKR